MASLLISVTGPAGVDIGPAVARVAAVAGLGDGLAVRVVDSHRGTAAHTSPDPYHRRRDPAVDEATADDPWTEGQVRLRRLPSAWQDPDTNLGIAFTRAPLPIGDDLRTMAALDLDPSHRLTVQARQHNLSPGHAYPLPVEVGDLGVHARDAVLRAGGTVVVESGNGMTHLDALAALNLAPWSPWIDQLHLWTVFDVAQFERAGFEDAQADHAERIARRVADGLTTLGGSGGPSYRIRAHVLLLGVDVADAGRVFARFHSTAGIHQLWIGVDSITR